jgi:hypothetical protein
MSLVYQGIKYFLCETKSSPRGRDAFHGVLTTFCCITALISCLVPLRTDTEIIDSRRYVCGSCGGLYNDGGINRARQLD